MKLLTVFGYISLFIFTITTFIGGKTLPMGFIFILFPLFFGLIISIYYIKLSIENKKLHFLCFSIIIFIAAFFAGISADIYETKNTKYYLSNVANKIGEYKLNNEIEYLTENDIKNINLLKDVRIELFNNHYKIFYKDCIYDSETEEIYFRSKP